MSNLIEVPRPLLEAAADELTNYLKADGGCDHSVGICSCEITGIISHLDHLLGRHQEKPDPYNCGSCVAEEFKIGDKVKIIKFNEDFDIMLHGIEGLKLGDVGIIQGFEEVEDDGTLELHRQNSAPPIERWRVEVKFSAGTILLESSEVEAIE